ncbi:MAG: PAS-domain containing protein [Acetobacteraceae bacterium]
MPPLPAMAELQRELAELRAERDAALAREAAMRTTLAAREAENRALIDRQAASIEVLKAISAAPDNADPVLELILRRAIPLANAQAANLVEFDGTLMHQRVFVGGDPEARARLLAAFPRPPGPETMPGRAILSGQIVHVPDVQADPGIFQPGRGLGARAFLNVPLKREGRVIGALGFTRFDPGEFDESAVALVQAFAEQAVIAMENARLLKEQREALARQTATAEVLQVINASPGDLQPVFDTMLEKATRLCDAHSGFLWTYDGEQYRGAATRNLPPTFNAFLAEAHRPGAETGIARLASGEELVQFVDMAAAPSYQHGDPLHRLSVDTGGFRTVLVVPMHKDGRLLGGFTANRQEVRPFSDKQIALLQAFAAQAVIAMENARLLEEIRRRQEELRITFENMGDGVALFDSTPCLVAWNRNFQDILDVPDDTVLQRPTVDDYLRYLADRGEFGADPDLDWQLQRLLGDGSSPVRFERTRPNGRIIEIRQNPVPGGGFVLIYTDITDRKQAEEALRAARDSAESAYRDLHAAQANLIQAEKMASLGQLTAGIAHEIKNPLNFVNNFAALSVDLLDELKETAAPAFASLDGPARGDIAELTETLTSNLKKIEEHGRRADGIVRSMLEHSRASSGERRAVDLNALVDEALNLAYHGARAQDPSFNIILEREFGAGIAPLQVSPQDLMRVFLNLFSNGFYAARKRQQAGTAPGFEPMLRVTTQDLGEAVQIRVHDNGTGVPAEMRDKLFQPFFTTKPTGEGTGLGLSITYDIVTKQHAGTITLDSEPGAYTEFIVTIPRIRSA